jgi:hypothetical protein
VLLGRPDVPDDDPGLGVLALQADEVARQRHVEQDHHAGAVRDEIAPGLEARARDRRGHDLEVLRPAVVRQDHEVRAVVLDRVAHHRPVGRDQPRLGVRVEAVDEPDFRGLVVTGRDGHERLRGGHLNVHEPAGVGFLVDQFVLVGGLAEPVTHHARGAVVFVQLDVVEALRVPGPDDVAGGSGNLVG